MNRGPVSQPESRSSGRDQVPARGAGTSAQNNGGGWQRFPSSSNRGAAPVDRGNAGNNARTEAPSNNGGGWNRGSRPEPSNPGNGSTNGRGQFPSSGSGGWDRGSRQEAPRD